ncbi:hypothetical protein CEH05_03180 [Halobacillus halophilus]|uniref:Uncharacterized protein n=1 Tax=Halobacillus halophilus (strain ATCC 35676 / DSM 2266 / JCM 20832 / KCTC 3685 / LMG 17431 / NBRC 102448 / NCIMB 2269) TaxID=866895 RepID=I0JIL4_HALH3|nr:hypothetical protein CEH05_03180 [Halobacillus halophilus]CCG43982.1 hypothetical protein HBHAL_1615 [Halobacillus halophilus DSM 2266]
MNKLVIEAFRTYLEGEHYLFWKSPLFFRGCVGGEMARLPWEKELGEIPQGVKRARKLTVPP